MQVIFLLCWKRAIMLPISKIADELGLSDTDIFPCGFTNCSLRVSVFDEILFNSLFFVSGLLHTFVVGLNESAFIYNADGFSVLHVVHYGNADPDEM